MTLKFNSIPRKTLSAPITASATSFTLSDILNWNGDALTSADFGTEAYGVLHDAKNTVVEFFAFDPTTIADSAIDFTYRGLALTGENLTTEVSANKKEWGKGTYVEIGTHPPQIFQWLKEYIDGIAIAGSPDSTTSVKGIGKVSVAPADPAAPIFVGDNDPRVPTADENDALAGGGDLGTPSSANKYATQEYVDSDVQEFSSDGTWTKPPVGTLAFIECWGGGGSGGMAQRSPISDAMAGRGGGGGEYVSALIPIAYLSSTVAVTIGAGGAAATGSGANTGNDGGDTTFGAYVTASGGTGGGAWQDTGTGQSLTAGGAGGTGGSVDFAEAKLEDGAAGGSTSTSITSTGTVNAGGDSTYSGAGGGSAQLSDNNSGESAGGTSTYGGDGGAGDYVSGTAVGVAGSAKGGGGGGAVGTGGSSGAGGDGYCRVTTF